MKPLNSIIIPTLLIASVAMCSAHAAAQESYVLDGLSRTEARAYIASRLLDIPMADIDKDRVGANYSYNDWTWPNENSECSKSSVGGHPGLDLQTKDVARASDPVRNRKFYALSPGRIIRAGGTFGTVAVYSREDDMTTLYLHTTDINVRVGDYVELGDYLGIQSNIGLTDNEGNQLPANAREHVHIENRRGERDGPACGAANPRYPGSETSDPVDYLYQKIRENSGNVSEQIVREDLSTILPATMSGAQHYKKCDGGFRLDFNFDTYSNPEDLELLVIIWDQDRDEEIVKVSLNSNDFDYVENTGFRVHEYPQRRYRVRESINFNSHQENLAEDEVLVRVYAQNVPVSKRLGNYDGINWESRYTMFIPYLLEEQLDSRNTPYTNGRQSDAQRYIKVNTDSCR